MSVFDCKLRHFQIQWTHGDKIVSTHQSLVIDNVDVIDSGEYICTATNDYGTSSISFKLNVLSKIIPFVRILN